MSIVVKRYIFDAAHLLPLHAGKCKNLHGHTYQVEVHIKGQVNGSTGMIVDFGQISEVVKPIIKEYDHSLILGTWGLVEDGTVTSDLFDLAKKNRWGVTHIPYPHTTAEFIAKKIRDDIIFYWPTPSNIVGMSERKKLWVKVAIWETPTSYARTNWEVLNESE